MNKREIITKKYKSPVDFMKEYLELFEEQIGTPKKIMLKEIDYYKEYEESLFNYIMSLSSMNKLNIEQYKEIENILETTRSRTYYDVDFFELTILQYVKGVAFLLDRLDTEVKKGNFDNIDLLYYFCNLNIDLKGSLSVSMEKDISFAPVLSLEKEPNEEIRWQRFQTLVDYINTKIKQDELSTIADNHELKKRYKPSDDIIGPIRIRKYYLGECLILILKRSNMSNNDKYFLTTTFISDFLTNKIGCEEDIAALKDYSQQLLM